MSKIIAKIPASPKNSYPIWIQTNLLKDLSWLSKILSEKQLVIITDNTVEKLYANRLVQSLKQQGYKTLLLSFPAGEKSKNYENKQRLENEMFERQCGKDSLCIALGGGVVGDLTGFLAATYMRGIPYIQIPTTLLSMIDSSVGGKTGINNSYGKNLVGTFWQPLAVIADIDCLNTLPKKQLINGLIEAIKIFLTKDSQSFFYCKNHLSKLVAGDKISLKTVISRAVKLKITIVQQDERETHLRMMLNFGHTIGHALEQMSQYKILHGFAVGLGILVEAKIAQLLGLLNTNDYLIISNILASLGIQASSLQKFDVNTLIQMTRLDKKADKKSAKYVLLKSIGNVHRVQNNIAHKVTDKIVKKAFLETAYHDGK